MDCTAKIVAALLEIRDAAQAAQSSPDIDAETLMKRYGIIFLGKKFNIITGVELYRTLNVKFGVQITRDAFLQTIPLVCAELGMDVQPLVRLGDVGKANPPIADYSIILF